eukprot:scaffold346_cov116-Cylindrotheca_fusiformis.AAC.10
MKTADSVCDRHFVALLTTARELQARRFTGGWSLEFTTLVSRWKGIHLVDGSSVLTKARTNSRDGFLLHSEYRRIRRANKEKENGMVAANNTNELPDPAALRSILQSATTEALARAQRFEFPGRVHARAEREAAEIENAFVGIVPTIKRVATFLSVGALLLSSSLFFYGLLYLAVMPSYNATRNLYFDYSGIAKHPAPVPVCSDETNICGERHSIDDKRLFENAPWAVADLFSKHSQWEAFHADCVPKPLTDSRILNPGTAFFLEVTLDLPESEINLMSGVFGIFVEIQSHNGTILASSLRSSRIPHETRWVSTVRTALMLIPLLLGATQEIKQITVSSFRHFVEIPDMPLPSFYFRIHKRYVTVKLIQRRIPPIEVTNGFLRIGQELSENQSILKDYFFTCYVIGSAIIFIFQLCLLAIVRLYLEKRRMNRSEEEPSLNLELDGSQFGTPVDVAWDGANEIPLNVRTTSSEVQNAEDTEERAEGSRTPPLHQEYS